MTIVSENGTVRNLLNAELIRDFFETLRHPETDDFYQPIWTKGDKNTTIWVPSGDIDSLVNAAYTQAQMGRDVYFGVGLQTVDLGPRSRGGTDDVTAVRMISADLDVGNEGHKNGEKYPETEARCMDIISGLPAPSLVVRSGNGLHVHWLLREPIIFRNVGEHKEFHTFVKSWMDAINAIAYEYGGYKFDNTSDLARILRVAGTLNFKGEPKPVTLLASNDLRYTLTDLSTYVRKAPAVRGASPSATDADRLESAAEAIAPHVGKGENHNLSLYLFGFLRGLDGDRLSDKDARRVVSRAWELGGFPPNPDHRLLMQGLDTTNAKIAAGEHVTGGGKLEEIAPGLPRELGSILWPENRIRPKRGDGEEPPGIDVLADRMIAGADGTLCFSMGEWKRYEKGVWTSVDDVMVEKLAVNIARAAVDEGVKYSWNLANQIASTVKRDLAVPSDLWDRQPNLLACRNVTLNLETFEPIEHSPTHYLTAGVPYEYDPEATGPNWDTVTGYIAENMGEDMLEFLQEYFGYTLTANTDAEIMLFLVGSRGAGKSTLLEGAENMLGPDLFLASTLAGLQQRFGRGGIVGKRLIVSKEMSQLKLLETDLIDSIISGEAIPIEKKNRDQVTYAPIAKVMQAANKLPRVPNTEAGIYRRLKVIEFPPPRFTTNTDVKAGLKNEGPYILNWALAGLKRLMDRGYFVVPESVELASQTWHNENNMVGLFLETCLRDGELTVTQTEIHKLYVKWCNDHKLMPLSLPEYTKATWKKEDFYLEHGGVKDGYKVLRGIGLTDAGRKANTVGAPGFRSALVEIFEDEVLESDIV